MQAQSNMEESDECGNEAWRDSAEKNRTVPVSRKQTAVTRESTSWKNMISFLFAGNYVSRCVYTVNVYV